MWTYDPVDAVWKHQLSKTDNGNGACHTAVLHPTKAANNWFFPRGVGLGVDLAHNNWRRIFMGVEAPYVGGNTEGYYEKGDFFFNSEADGVLPLGWVCTATSDLVNVSGVWTPVPWPGNNGSGELRIDMADDDYALSTSEAAFQRITVTGALTVGAKALTFPAPANDAKGYARIVKHAGSGQNITVTTGAGAAVTLTPGQSALVWFNDTDGAEAA